MMKQEDHQRIGEQRARVFAYMSDSAFRTLGEIEGALGYPQSSISARLRDFRKRQHGGHVVNKRYLGRGLWAYRLVVQENNEREETL